MPTTLATPSKADLIEFNRQTLDGDGTVPKADVLDDIVDMRHLAFGYGVEDLDDPVELGMAFAWRLVNEHVFCEGSRSTATPTLERVLVGNGRGFAISANDPRIITIVNDLYDTGFEGIAAGVEEIGRYVR